ncbi:DNA invertase Pin-like site-specific DNA recombinase [Flavobacterium nitrogenifigens]|uniref:DNA invertase Pin-like site-specific DNA recombinase n=2 Tax=Flavobacterium TaxID=237 RepID=A0A7W7NA58_9FLAO|nr:MULTISPECIES: recombinase family protein [Flavobacterium]MBB4804196.1 DNA invertase Pin-like site-specific DNA recombinase [Flavobacterium nitrogenifigens]MBB6389155.1 DNA invertase Pin-like site-specific DNA recombinase [Flavobacterium notoginsengisoli]
MKRVAVYVRVSTMDQVFERQIADVKNYIHIEHRGQEFEIDIYSENLSGYREAAKRPELTKFLDLVEKDPSYYDCLYVTELSRLGRNPVQTRLIIEGLIAKKIQVCVTTTGAKMLNKYREPDKISIAVFQLLMEFADVEADTFKKRSASGLLQSARAGNANGSRNYPYGYRKDENKKLVVDEEEAEIIKEIFENYKNGFGFKKIAGFLNERKVPTRTNKAFGNQLMKFNTNKTADKVIWSDKTINDIVTNPLYKGLRRYKGEKLNKDEVYEGIIIKRGKDLFKAIILDAPSIVSAELFDECNKIVKTKTHRNSAVHYEYILKDLLSCGRCGRNMFAKYKPVVGGDKVYICSSRLIKGGNCGNAGVNITYLDSVIYDLLIGQNALLDKIDQSDKLIPTVKLEIEKLKKELSLAESELSKQNKRMQKLFILFRETEMDTEEYNRMASQDKKDLSTIVKRIEILKNSLREKNETLEKIANKDKDEDFIKKLAKDRPEIRLIFKQFIKKIYITKLSVGKDILLDVHFQIGNNRPESTLKIMIDQFATRAKQKIKYTYKLGYSYALVTQYDEKGVLLNSEEDIYSIFSQHMSKTIYEVEERNLLIL